MSYFGSCHQILTKFAKFVTKFPVAVTKFPEFLTEFPARLWPGKGLMVNFPSSIHGQEASVVQASAEKLYGELLTHGRAVMGVVEDIPTSQHLPLLFGLADRFRF